MRQKYDLTEGASPRKLLLDCIIMNTVPVPTRFNRWPIFTSPDNKHRTDNQPKIITCNHKLKQFYCIVDTALVWTNSTLAGVQICNHDIVQSYFQGLGQREVLTRRCRLQLLQLQPINKLLNCFVLELYVLEIESIYRPEFCKC